MIIEYRAGFDIIVIVIGFLSSSKSFGCSMLAIIGIALEILGFAFCLIPILFEYA
jgi:hypothetical protein